MELNINELEDYNYDFDNISIENYDELDYIPPKNSHSFEEIPENTFPKKKIHFNEPIKPMIQSIPKMNSKMVRQKVVHVKPQISYDDIIKKMGMFVVNGKLHLLEDNTKLNEQLRNNQKNNYNQQNNYNQTNKLPIVEQNMNQNSYIYNKYFKDQLQSEEKIRRPMTLMEYRNKTLRDILQKKRINEIKSTKLMFPTSNINISGNIRNQGEMNKLFNFSKR